MATDDLSNNQNGMQHMRQETKDAYASSQLAKWLSILALIASAIALTVAMAAMNRADEAQRTADQAMQRVQSQ